ncbi:MAG: DUF1275 domain-containing protein [Holophagaceae bacterium]|nr:DUF1275 domain-containing protein [Holophagaceae bacterium]
MPRSNSRRILRIARKRTLLALRGKVDLQHGIGQTLNKTLDLLPIDSQLLNRRGNERKKYLNRQMAWSMAFVAGAINAGGFLAVEVYTSHITGAVARASDEWALGHHELAFSAVAMVLTFLLGAAFTGSLINFGQRRRFRSHYAISLMVEAGLLLVFGFAGYRLTQREQFFLPVTAILLSFIMGMHNATVTNVSNAEVRTTHMTGIVTDLGVELSRLFYFNRTKRKRANKILANRDRIKLHCLVLLSFLVGGFFGALGFKHIGYKVTLFFSAFLFFLAWRPILYDLRVRIRLARQAP